jgi:hypothetical protein
VQERFTIRGVTYQIAGPNHDSIGLPVEPPNLPDTITVEGYKLTRRSAFHVTLIAVGRIGTNQRTAVPNFLELILTDFRSFVEQHPVRLLRYRNEFRFASENDRRSLVVTCDLENLDRFYDVLKTRYDLQTEYPPTHVTLYTLQRDLGIFLTDSNDINRLTKSVPNPGIELA